MATALITPKREIQTLEEVFPKEQERFDYSRCLMEHPPELDLGELKLSLNGAQFKLDGLTLHECVIMLPYYYSDTESGRKFSCELYAPGCTGVVDWLFVHSNRFACSECGDAASEYIEYRGGSNIYVNLISGDLKLDGLH